MIKEGKKINYAWPVTAASAVVYQHFLSKIEQNHSCLSNRTIIIFGAGIRGCLLLCMLEKRGLKKIVFCDNNPSKQGHRIDTYDIYSLSDALRLDGEKIILISPENSSSMSLQLTEMGLKKNKDWISLDISLYNTYLAEYLRPVNNHLLVLGDCGFTHIALTDNKKDSLGDMIKNRYGVDCSKVLAMHGIGQQAQYHIIRSLINKGERPLLLLLLLVMEVLTPKAHLMPRTQHPELIDMLVGATKKPDEEFRIYAKLARERFNRFQVESFASSDTQNGDNNVKLFMKMNYLFKIREETEGVIYLKKTVKLLNDEKIPIILYIPPVNYVQGERYFGTGFKQKYYENFNKLYSFLDKENLQYSVADASFLISDEFAATNTIDESLNYNGRTKLLQFISGIDQIKNMFSYNGSKNEK